MGATFREYAIERRARLSPEGQRALRVFNSAHSLGSALAQARQMQGLSQRDLEARSGIDQGDISRIERGELSPTTPTLMRLTQAMRARLVVELFDEENWSPDLKPVVITHTPTPTNELASA